MKKNIKAKARSKSSNKIPYPNLSNLNNNNKINKSLIKYDNNKLNCLLDDLIKKDLKYDLIIQGIKEKINTKKRENNYLEKEIEQLNKETNNIIENNKKLNMNTVYKKKENKINFNYKTNVENIRINYMDEKYKEELNKYNEIKDKISRIKNEINEYQNKKIELKSLLYNNNECFYKEEEKMKKFLSEL